MPNEEIDSLVNKYSSASSDRRRSPTNNTGNRFSNHQSTSALNYNHNHEDSFSMLDLQDSHTNAEAGGGDLRRSRSKKDKPRRKQRRSSRMSASTSSLMGRDYDEDFLNDDNNHNNSSSPDIMNQNNNNKSSPGRGTLPRQNSASPATRASVSPSFYDTEQHSVDTANILLERGSSKYVLPPPPVEEEQNALLLYNQADPNDPLSGPPIQNFQDEFEDEMDEIEMQDRTANFINLSDLEAASKRRKTSSRLCQCMKLLCCLMVLTAIVGAVVAIVQTTQKETVAKIPQAVPKLEARQVGLWCNEGLDLGPGQEATYPLEVSADCKNACLKAECCWHPTGDYVCTPETWDNCEAYKHECDVMIPHVTSDGDDNGDGVIKEDENGIVVPPAPATIKTTCVPVGPSFTATDVCNDICQKASCCWDDTSDEDCEAQSYQNNCQPYREFCSFFNDHPHNNNQEIDEDLPFPLAPPNLATYCSQDQVENGGLDRCQDECADASCCWKMGVVNCASTVPNNMCEPYADACKVLNAQHEQNANGNSSSSNTNEEGVTIPPAPSGLDVYCDPSEMEEISLHICQDKCDEAKCCWSTSEEACPTSVPSELCQPYVQACAILNDLKTYPDGTPVEDTVNNNNDIPQAPADFATRCSRDNIAGSENGGSILIACEEDCLQASCCWRPNVDQCTENSRCSDYQEPCSIFVGLFSDNSGQDSTTNNEDSSNTSSNSVVPAAPSDLASTCSPERLTVDVNNGAGIVECEKECLAGACCWKEGHPTSCPDAPECSAYMEPCGNHLVEAILNLEGHGRGTTTSNPVADEIASACNTQVALFVKTRCENECRPGACCFDDTMACSAGLDCGMYDPCNVLYRKRHELLRH